MILFIFLICISRFYAFEFEIFDNLNIMASSQVEIACVLKDYNNRIDRRRDSNPNLNQKSQSNFQRNLKELVRDHFNSCISISPRDSDLEQDENSHNQGSNFSCFGGSNSSRRNNQRKPLLTNNTNQKSCSGEEDEEVSSPLLSKNQSQALKKQNQEAEIIALSKSNSASSSRGSTSSADFSVSSLVQKWRGFEANNNGGVNTQNSSVSRVNSEVSNCESTITTTTTTTEDYSSSSELESDNKEQQLQPQEPIKVADIVRKWTKAIPGACDEGGNQEPPSMAACLARLRIGLEPGHQGAFTAPIVCSPRLRGRQAIADLYTRMERERYKEVESLASRQSVSKFTHRGRIQSLLKLRFLRREVSDPDHRQPPQSMAVRFNRSQIASSITSLRERFSTTANQVSSNMKPNICRDTTETKQDPENNHTSVQVDLNIISPLIETINDNNDMERSSTSNQESEQQTTTHQEKTNTEPPQLRVSEEELVQRDLVTSVMEDILEEIPSSDVIWQETSYDDDDVSPRSYNGWEDDDEEEEEEMFADEQEADTQHFFETNLDWISDIARPRSYWEDCRQARYQEIFNTRSQNEEIRQLLDRGSVSAVLASDFRDRMDRLVMCSVQRAMHSNVNEEEEEEEDRSMRAFLGRLMPSFDQHQEEEQEDHGHVEEHIEDVEQDQEDREVVEEENGEVEEGEEEEEDEKEEESSSLHQYNDVSDYYGQTPSSSQSRCGNYQDHDTQEGCSVKNSSIEMELIYNLRTHMEQVYREMSELRKSITSCMDMQVKLQHSIREEVSAAISHKDRDEVKKDSDRRKPKKGSCCICYEKKVDSLLYRCGHMCTCFNCAHELQWSSGKCPICRAQIVDVVRAYPDT